LLPVFEGRKRRPHPALCWEHEGNRAVRQGDWKLVSRHPSNWELYNLARDRTEMQDLASREPKRVRDMTALYNQWAVRCGVVDWDTLPKAGS